MTLIAQKTLAYVNHGRWIADCPREFCNNAFRLEAHQPLFQCIGHGSCGMVASIVWPYDADEIWSALNRRPVPATRNWYPKAHPLAERFGLPDGQTPKELLDEQMIMEKGAEG